MNTRSRKKGQNTKDKNTEAGKTVKTDNDIKSSNNTTELVSETELGEEEFPIHFSQKQF